jgi:hypothetical protein
LPGAKSGDGPPRKHRELKSEPRNVAKANRGFRMNIEPNVSDGIFPSLESKTRRAVPTACAAYHLGRRPQTLRGWACREDGPLRPIRIHGRLAWSVVELRRLVGVGE